MTVIDRDLLECALEVVKEVQVAYLKRNQYAIPLHERTLLCFAREVIKQSKLGDTVWLNRKIARVTSRLKYTQRRSKKLGSSPSILESCGDPL